MAQVPKPPRLPTADSGEGPLWAIPHSDTHTPRKLLVFPGAASGVHNQGRLRGKEEGGGRGDYATDK